MVTTTDLVSYWKLDESSGDAIDAHGSNDGTVTGATQNVSGKINTCYDFDGVGDQIAINKNPGQLGIDGATARTTNLWAYSSTTSGVKAMYGVGTRSTGQSWELYKLSATSYRVALNGTADLTVTTSDLDDGWHMFTAVYDGTDAYLYVDGTEADSKTVTINTASTGTSLKLGNDITGTQEWEGKLDEIGLWDAALSSSDISDLYNSGSGLAYPFSSGTTVNPSTLTLSTTQQSPSYFIDVTAGALNITTTLWQPNLSIPVIATPSTLAMTLSVLAPTTNGETDSMTGTIGTAAIATRYPVEEGLIARTTKQTGNPNLIATEEGTW